VMEGGTQSRDGGRDPKSDDLMEGGTPSLDGGRDPSQEETGAEISETFSRYVNIFRP
jgi:hypothetical protein